MIEQTLCIGVQQPVYLSLLDRLTNQPYNSDTLTTDSNSFTLTVINSSGAINYVDMSGATCVRTYGGEYKIVLSSSQTSISNYVVGQLSFVASEVQPVTIPLKFQSVEDGQIGSTHEFVLPKSKKLTIPLSFLSQDNTLYSGTSLTNLSVDAVSSDGSTLSPVSTDNPVHSGYGSMWGITLTTPNDLYLSIGISADEIQPRTFFCKLLTTGEEPPSFILTTPNFRTYIVPFEYRYYSPEPSSRIYIPEYEHRTFRVEK